MAALLAFPGFFQGQPVVVRGHLTTRDQAVLTSPSVDKAIPVFFSGASPAEGDVELRATFWDIGRLQRDDPRIAGQGLMRLVPNNGEGDWPRPGEVVALVVTEATVVKPPGESATLRLIALAPETFVGKQVTVTGQFRGRNLFGDLPQAPNQNQWEFVLHNGDAGVWVIGERPRGKGFNLDVGARMDTRAWLTATGTVREQRGLVWIEATQLALAKPDLTFVVEAPPPVQMGPDPEVIFSDPEDGDTNVPMKKVIRLQFSRDMDPNSFKGNIRWHYAASDAREELPQANLAARYERSNRSIEIKLTGDDLIRFRNIVIELTNDVVASDGAKLRPWSMTFTFAGQ